MYTIPFSLTLLDMIETGVRPCVGGGRGCVGNGQVEWYQSVANEYRYIEHKG